MKYVTLTGFYVENEDDNSVFMLGIWDPKKLNIFSFVSEKLIELLDIQTDTQPNSNLEAEIESKLSSHSSTGNSFNIYIFDTNKPYMMEFVGIYDDTYSRGNNKNKYDKYEVDLGEFIDMLIKYVKRKNAMIKKIQNKTKIHNSSRRNLNIFNQYL